MKRKGKKLNVFKVIIAILIIAIICGVFIKITHKKEENVETSSKTKVEDTEAPKINLNGNSEEIIIYGEDYEEKKNRTYRKNVTTHSVHSITCSYRKIKNTSW